MHTELTEVVVSSDAEVYRRAVWFHIMLRSVLPHLRKRQDGLSSCSWERAWCFSDAPYGTVAACMLCDKEATNVALRVRAGALLVHCETRSSASQLDAFCVAAQPVVEMKWAEWKTGSWTVCATSFAH